MMTFGIDFDMELLNGDSRDDVESGGFYFDSLMRHLDVRLDKFPSMFTLQGVRGLKAGALSTYLIWHL